jgi:hypothetical protein
VRSGIKDLPPRICYNTKLLPYKFYAWLQVASMISAWGVDAVMALGGAAAAAAAAAGLLL